MTAPRPKRPHNPIGAALAIGAAAAIAAAAALSAAKGSRARYRIPTIERMGDGTWRMWTGYRQDYGRSYVAIDPHALEENGVDIEEISEGGSYVVILSDYMADGLRRMNTTRRVKKVLQDSIIELRLPDEFPSEDAGQIVTGLLIEDNLLRDASWLDNVDVTMPNPGASIIEMLVNVEADSDQTAVDVIANISYEFLTEETQSNLLNILWDRHEVDLANKVRDLDADEYPPLALALMLNGEIINPEDIDREAVSKFIANMPEDERDWMFKVFEREFRVQATIGGARRIMLDTADGPMRLEKAFGYSPRARGGK